MLFATLTHALSTDSAANVELDPGTLLLTMDLGERVTLTGLPVPVRRVGLWLSKPSAVYLSQYGRGLSRGGEMAAPTFQFTLVLACSGGPDLVVPERVADTLSPVADFATDPRHHGIFHC
jgi:hypothetical protein